MVIARSCSLSFLACAAEIGFEQTMYAAVDTTGAVDVCVAVGNGRLANSLSIPINVLPTSTATGIYFTLMSHFTCLR